jgi:hypothetical protein
MNIGREDGIEEKGIDDRLEDEIDWEEEERRR